MKESEGENESVSERSKKENEEGTDHGNSRVKKAAAGRCEVEWLRGWLGLGGACDEVGASGRARSSYFAIVYS